MKVLALENLIYVASLDFQNYTPELSQPKFQKLLKHLGVWKQLQVFNQDAPGQVLARLATEWVFNQSLTGWVFNQASTWLGF